MYQKTQHHELTSKSLSEQRSTDVMRSFHKSHLDDYGVTWNWHSLVTLQRQSLSRVLYYNALYQKIVGVPGVILEFGVQWGATMAQLIALRGIYEPYNHRRHIYGFDTFEGFANTSQEKDGLLVSEGDYRVTKDYEHELEAILQLHENDAPISHQKKFSLIKGDASLTSKQWVADNPHAVVAMAIFDMDIYQPTKDALEAIITRLTKGSLLVFDELNCPQFPGETQAVNEVLGLNKIRLHHFPHQPNCAWAIWGE